MNAAKDLANLPGNICTPSYLASTKDLQLKNMQNLITAKYLERKK